MTGSKTRRAVCALGGVALAAVALGACIPQDHRIVVNTGDDASVVWNDGGEVQEGRDGPQTATQRDLDSLGEQ